MSNISYSQQETRGKAIKNKICGTMFLPEATAVNRVHTLLWWEQDSDPASLTETDGDRWRQTETDGERWRRRGGGLPCSLQDFAAASHSCLSTELFSMPYDQITHIPHRERPNANECEYVCVLGCWRRKRRTRGREGRTRARLPPGETTAASE